MLSLDELATIKEERDHKLIVQVSNDDMLSDGVSSFIHAYNDGHFRSLGRFHMNQTEEFLKKISNVAVKIACFGILNPFNLDREYYQTSFQHYIDLKKKGLIDYMISGDFTPRYPYRPGGYDNIDLYVEHGIEGLDCVVSSFSLEETRNILLCEEPFAHNHGYVMLGMSGSGKSTLIRHLLKYVKGIKHVTKVTTREKRGDNPEEGVANVSVQDFSRMQKNGDLVGCYRFDGNHYGYSRIEIYHSLFLGNDLFFDTTQANAALNLRESFPGLVKIVYVQSDMDFASRQMVKRYSRIPSRIIHSPVDMTRIYDNRMRELERMAKSETMMASAADFILTPDYFSRKQQTLRNYILGQRFPGMVVTEQVTR